MNNILMIHIGRSSKSFFSWEGMNTHHWYSQTEGNLDSMAEEGSSLQALDYQDETQVCQSFMALSPISDVVIMIEPESAEVTAEISQSILNDTFSVLKASIQPLMRQRSGKVYIVGLDESQSTSEMTAVTNAGLIALSKVVALEVARKKVVVNFIKRSEFSEDTILNFIRMFSVRKNMFITGQILHSEGA